MRKRFPIAGLVTLLLLAITFFPRESPLQLAASLCSCVSAGTCGTCGDGTCGGVSVGERCSSCPADCGSCSNTDNSSCMTACIAQVGGANPCRCRCWTDVPGYCTEGSDYDYTCSLPACNDGTDNDGDSLTDTNDPGCTGLSDEDETNVASSAASAGSSISGASSQEETDDGVGGRNPTNCGNSIREPGEQCDFGTANNIKRNLRTIADLRKAHPGVAADPSSWNHEFCGSNCRWVACSDRGALGASAESQKESVYDELDDRDDPGCYLCPTCKKNNRDTTYFGWRDSEDDPCAGGNGACTDIGQCNEHCVVPSQCGDGKLQPQEKCDSGSLLLVETTIANKAWEDVTLNDEKELSKSGCLATCQIAACADGEDNDSRHGADGEDIACQAGLFGGLGHLSGYNREHCPYCGVETLGGSGFSMKLSSTDSALYASLLVAADTGSKRECSQSADAAPCPWGERCKEGLCVTCTNDDPLCGFCDIKRWPSCTEGFTCVDASQSAEAEKQILLCKRLRKDGESCQTRSDCEGQYLVTQFIAAPLGNVGADCIRHSGSGADLYGTCVTVQPVASRGIFSKRNPAGNLSPPLCTEQPSPRLGPGGSGPLCSGLLGCAAEICLGKIFTCDDGNACTRDVCNEMTGVCEPGEWTVPVSGCRTASASSSSSVSSSAVSSVAASSVAQVAQAIISSVASSSVMSTLPSSSQISLVMSAFSRGNFSRFALLNAELCGNGVVDVGELCDWKNQNDDFAPNACRTDCHPARCADRVIDAGEECDDGNIRFGDGCDEFCLISRSRSSSSSSEAFSSEEIAVAEPQEYVPTDGDFFLMGIGSCGNGIMDPGELCDDGNIRDGDGCNTLCIPEAKAMLITREEKPSLVLKPEILKPSAPQLENVTISSSSSMAPVAMGPFCGNGIMEGVEECDDANRELKDGCDFYCRRETQVLADVAASDQRPAISGQQQTTSNQQPITDHQSPITNVPFAYTQPQFYSYPQPLPFAQLQPLIAQVPQTTQSGPAAVAAIGAGTAAGWSWIRRKR